MTGRTWRKGWPPLLRLLAAALALVPAAQAGQDGAAESVQEDSVVVTGRRDAPPPEATFVEALAVPSANRQLARVEKPVCPAALGLSGADAEALTRRIRRIARAAGAQVADARCRANLVVLVVANRARAIEHWRRQRPDFFAGMTQREIDALAGGSGPVVAWQVVEMKGPGGRQVGRVDSMYDYSIVPEAIPYRLGRQVQFEFSGSFLLVEAAAIGDASITQLADYAAMRTLARTDPAAAMAQPLPTILAMFERPGEPVPLSVTEWDLRFLRALYSARIADNAAAQQRDMARSVRRQAEVEE